MKFIQQAYNGINGWWSYIVTLFTMFFWWQIIGLIPLIAIAFYYTGSWEAVQIAAIDNFASLGINKNLYLFVMVIMFVFGLFGLLLGIKFIHKRSITSVFTSRTKVDFKRILFAFFVWAIIGVFLIGISYFIEPETFQWNFKPVPFLILVLISIIFLPFQTTMEEILFRGYLMQGFGIWFKKSFVSLVLTSVIFGLLHGLNPEVEKLGYITMVYYIGTGFLLGIITLLDEGIELAVGFHAANNIVAAILVTTNWTVFQTDALLIDTSEPSVGFELFLPVFVLYPLVLVIFSKKYEWTNWKEKLLSKVYKPIELNEDEFIA